MMELLGWLCLPLALPYSSITMPSTPSSMQPALHPLVHHIWVLLTHLGVEGEATTARDSPAHRGISAPGQTGSCQWAAMPQPFSSAWSCNGPTLTVTIVESLPVYMTFSSDSHLAKLNALLKIKIYEHLLPSLHPLI